MSRKVFYLFVGPSVVVMVLLMIVPLLASVWLGFHSITFRNITTPEWVGFENYVFMLKDPGFWNSFRFTIQYIVVTIPIELVLGLAVALLLDQVKIMRPFYIASALLPFIVTPVVGTLIFRQFFDRYGLVPYILQNFFGSSFSFFAPATMPALVIFEAIWYVTPFGIIVLYAGLQTIPQEMLEAANVDGATGLQRLRHIIIPNLRNLFILIALINIMDAYRVFDNIFVLTKQNPIYDNVQTLMYYNYLVAVKFQQLGRANAMSVLTVIGIFIILIPFLYTTYRQQIEVR